MDNSGRSAWGPAPWISSLTLLGMLGAIAWRLLDSDPENRVVAEVLVAVCAIVTLALVRIRVRLRVVDGGIVVTGPLRSRPIPWSRIHTISTTRRGRFGLRSTLLELEIRATGGPGATVDPRASAMADTGADAAADDDPGADADPDDELMTFGRFDLGTDPAEVGRELKRRRQAAG